MKIFDENYEYLNNLKNKSELSERTMMCLRNLAQNPQFATGLQSVQGVCENYQYFIDRLPALLTGPPTDEDLLKTRVKTQVEAPLCCMYQHQKIQFLDLAGQREARGVWASKLKDANFIMYFASVGDFDQVCAEDGKTNRVVESLQLFGGLINTAQLSYKPVILCLNKIDVLQAKLAQGKQFKSYVTSYSGLNTCEAVLAWAEAQFRQKDRFRQARKIIVFRTVATDTGLIKKVADEVFSFALEQALRGIGFV